jgi:hypothetical protein
MSTLTRATIKSYSSGTHKAAVQLAGSLSVWLDAVRVATDIPPAEVVAGRECAVLFFTDDNPDDAVIVTVHGAVPAAPSAGARIADADGNTSVDTEASANEDKVRVTIAGTLRYLVQAASPHHQLEGDLRLGTGYAVHSQSITLDAGEYACFGNENTGIDGKFALQASLGGRSTPGAGTVTGVAGRGVARDTGTSAAYGLDYLAGCNGVSLAAAACVKLQVIAIGSGKTLTTGRGIHIQSPTVVLATLTNNTPIEIDPLTTGTNRKAIKVGDITGGMLARLIELGSNPDFMVKGTGELARAANQTLVFIAEGTGPTVRQVQWKDGAAIGAGDRVMVLV